MAYKDIEKAKEYQRRYYEEHKEERKERKKQVQKEYEKRTGYAANKKYRKENIKGISLQLNLNTDQDIIKKLDEVPNKQGYIKSLIRADISKSQQQKYWHGYINMI